MKKIFKKHRHHPQVMVEFVIMAFLGVMITFSLAWLLGIYSEYAWRILALIALDYP